MSKIVHIGYGKTATTNLKENVFPEIPKLHKEIKYNEQEIRHSIIKLWFLYNNNDEELKCQSLMLLRIFTYDFLQIEFQIFLQIIYLNLMKNLMKVPF
jgi:hypothetical protein